MTTLWRWPLFIGALTFSGLISGLVSEGIGDYLAWVGLGLPVIVALWFGVRRQRADRR